MKHETKLNLGCGEDIKKGFINIDFRKLPGVDITHNLMAPLPYEPGTIDYIFAQDVLEHFPYTETEKIFGYWITALKIGGEILIQVPNLEKHIQMYINKVFDPRYNKPVDIYRMRHLLFGCQKYEGGTHYTTFNRESVYDLFSAFRLQILGVKEISRAIIGTAKKLSNI
jgi:predicted SAM-dependent methyltransferase